MNIKKFKFIRVVISLFVAITVSIAVTLDNVILAFSGVLIGMLFLFLVKKKSKAVLYDERVKAIAGDSARLTYVVSTLVLAFLSLMFLTGSNRLESPFVETLGTIFSYTALFNVAVFAICFQYFNRKY